MCGALAEIASIAYVVVLGNGTVITWAAIIAFHRHLGLGLTVGWWLAEDTGVAEGIAARLGKDGEAVGTASYLDAGEEFAG